VTSPNYEFTDEQNRVIEPLSDKMGFVGIALIVLGLLSAINGILNVVGDSALVWENFLFAGIFLLLGFLTRRAAHSFRLIVITQGQDISFLMAALDEMRKAYTIQYWVFVAGAILLAIGIGMLVVANSSDPIATVTKVEIIRTLSSSSI